MYLFVLDKNKTIIVEWFKNQKIEITLIQKTFLFTKTSCLYKTEKN